MHTPFDRVIVCGNSDAFGSEIGERFQSIEESSKKAHEMTEPHPLSWPLQMKRFGLQTLNQSRPGSGVLSNIARAIKLFIANPKALFLIDISLIDHLPNEDREFHPRNAVMFEDFAIERAVHSLSAETQIFILNEHRKLLHQIGMNFKFIMFGNPIFDFTGLVPERSRRMYPSFLREVLLREIDLPAALANDCLLPKPYFHYFSSEKISPFCHITDPVDVMQIAELMALRVRELYGSN